MQKQIYKPWGARYESKVKTQVVRSSREEPSEFTEARPSFFPELLNGRDLFWVTQPGEALA